MYNSEKFCKGPNPFMSWNFNKTMRFIRSLIVMFCFQCYYFGISASYSFQNVDMDCNSWSLRDWWRCLRLDEGALGNRCSIILSSVLWTVRRDMHIRKAKSVQMKEPPKGHKTGRTLKLLFVYSAFADIHSFAWSWEVAHNIYSVKSNICMANVLTRFTNL